MTDRERLEIIKDKQMQMYELSTFDNNWLIEQAERADILAHENMEIRKGYQEWSKRVQELETYVEAATYIQRKLRKQNKHFREHLEYMLAEAKDHKEKELRIQHWALIKDLEKALEELE